MEPREISAAVDRILENDPTGGDAELTPFMARLLTHYWSDIENVVRARAAKDVYTLRIKYPDGSEHYRSGWADAVDTAFDLLKDGNTSS